MGALEVNKVVSTPSSRPPKQQKGNFKKRQGQCYLFGQEGYFNKDKCCPACQTICTKHKKVLMQVYVKPNQAVMQQLEAIQIVERESLQIQNM